MKILILFGSFSDEYIYRPLKDALEDRSFDVELEIISAHRDPDKLDEKLRTTTCDFILAGAGLAAHLPGVVASKIAVPVFGVSVPAQFGGLDSLCSIQQMPFGVPVIAFGPSLTKEIILNLASFREWSESKASDDSVQLYCDSNILKYEYVQFEIDRILNYGKELSMQIALVHKHNLDRTTVTLVHDEKMIIPQKEGVRPIIHVPIIEKTERNAPALALKILIWTEKGGGWCGVNNGRNALKFLKKFDR